MKKYAINYTRQFPQHRVSPDFMISAQLNNSLLTRLKMFKAGWVHRFAKNFQFWFLGIFGVISFSFCMYKVRKTNNRQYLLANKTSKTSYKWGYLSENKDYGKFDIIFNKFENEPGGIVDWTEEPLKSKQ